MPQPTVALLSRSIRMKPPSVRLRAYGSNAIVRIQRKIAVADLVALQARRRQVRLGVRINAMLDLGDLRAQRARRGFQQVTPARQQCRIVQPQQVAGELRGDLRRLRDIGDHVAARHVNLVGERERDRLVGLGGLSRSPSATDHARHVRTLAAKAAR